MRRVKYSGILTPFSVNNARTQETESGFPDSLAANMALRTTLALRQWWFDLRPSMKVTIHGDKPVQRLIFTHSPVFIGSRLSWGVWGSNRILGLIGRARVLGLTGKAIERGTHRMKYLVDSRRLDSRRLDSRRCKRCRHSCFARR